MGKNFLGLDGLKHFWSKAKTWIINRITTEVTAKVAEIVANAPEDLDTLKEIADWISTHEDSASAMNTAILAKANRYGNSYNCVQCSHIAKNVDLGAYNYPTKRFVYIGNATDMSGNIGCNNNLWFCPTCNVLTMGDANGSAICLIGDGSCLMNGVYSRKNPSVVFATTDKQCACLQYSQYDAVHTGAGLCLASNTTNTWFDTDCVFANKFINRNGCQIGGYCLTIPSPSGNTKYALLDFGAVEASVYFSVHNNEGTIVKANTANPYGEVYAQNTYGITGFYSLGKESATNACFWLRYNGWRNVNLWGKFPIKVVSNTTTNPGCTWQSPTIKPTCDYVSTVAGQCKSAACTYANTVAGQCKGVACTYANTVAGQCKSAACAYANTVSFCNINVCRGLSIIGTSTYCDSKCWGTDGNWTYLTFTEAPGNHWHYVIKMDGYDACRRAGLAFPADDFQHQGVYYKLGFCGGNDGWKLIPDITCVQKAALSCGKASEISACAYADLRSEAACAWSLSCATTLVSNEETNRKNDDTLCLACSKAYTDTKALDACSFAVACVQKTTPDTSSFAKSYGGSTNCVEYSNTAKHVDLEYYRNANKRYIYIGQPDKVKNIGCNPNLWFCPTCNVLAMGGNDGATICLVAKGSASMAGDGTKLNPKIVFDTMDGQRGCLQYSQYDTIHEGAGLCWMTNQGSTWFDTGNIYANTLTVRNNSLRLGNYNIYIG